MWYPQVMVIAGIQQRLNARVGEQAWLLLLLQETSDPSPAQPAPSVSRAHRLWQSIKVYGTYFKSQYFQRHVSWDIGYAHKSTCNFLLPR